MGKKRKILIVEDSPTQALQLQLMLEKRNFEVITGINGEEALGMIDSNDLPDIIITDILMPIMDGYEFCKKIKDNEITRNIPVILLTQLSEADDVIKGLKSGADNFISKPYNEDFLFNRINDILLNCEIRKRYSTLDFEMEVFFGGQKHKLNSNRMQILDLLLSTYQNAINKSKELEEKNRELELLHKELKKKNEQLCKSADEKNHLLGIAAHDLRSPLTTVAAYFNLFVDELDNNLLEDQDTIIGTINNQLSFMLKLITDVLDFTKIEAGKLYLKKESFDIIDFMDEVLKLNNLLADQKKIKIAAKYEKDTPLQVNADKNKMKQVMNNLLSNAIKFSERNTYIYVYIIPQDKDVQVVVADEGKGIPAEEQGKLFKPFTKTSVRSTAGEKGAGLGLVSAKKIIETHGGKIWVESKVNEGTQFYFTIPK